MENEKALAKVAIGIFKGFTESGREFLAEVVTPYHPEFIPLLGSFILVTVADHQALLGRITQFYPMGTMAGTEADEYLSQLQRLNRPVPEDIKELKLRYNVKVRLLGTVQLANNQFSFRPGVRSLPHLGASVCLPTDESLQFICNARLENEPDAIPIGHYALGDKEFPNIEVKFSFSRLLSRRTLVFARAGYGKSNLIKLLVSKLYEQKPDVGMLIFDPEGEYSFRDAQGRPGLADIPGIEERLVVFTDRHPVDKKYQMLIAGNSKLNLAHIPATHIVDICLPEDRRDTVYATRIKGFTQDEWAECVSLLYEHGYRLRPNQLKRFALEDQQATAIIRNVTPIVHRLHDPSSHLPQSVIYYLAHGHIVVVDISLLSSGTGQQVAGLVLKTVFDHNVAHFTADEQDAVLPVIAVIEEAQNVLSNEKMKEDNPFVEWAKEGRKYRLGAILVTQQPGAISDQLLSQSDNFFALHLISNVDLDALQRNNAHFSDDILSYILSEPIEGNAYFWSAPSQPYVISAKLFDFKEYAKGRVEQMSAEEPKKMDFAVQSYQQILDKLQQLIRDIIASDLQVPVYTPERDGEIVSGYGAVNQMNLRLQTAKRFFETHKELKVWMLPEFFEVWNKGSVVLKQGVVLQFRQSVKGIKDEKQADYILVKLDQINFAGKALDGRRVNLIEQGEQGGHEQAMEPSSSRTKRANKKRGTDYPNELA